MIKCFLLDGEFQSKEIHDFYDVYEIVNINRKKLYKLKLNVIIELLVQLGKKILNDPSINAIGGVSYISMWLRRDNLRKICELNFLGPTYYEDFQKTDFDFEMCAQPRGVVCQWIAANMPTLAFFSLVQSILSKNGSVLNVPEQNKEIILAILKNLSKININFKGTDYSGEDIVKSVAILSFGKDPEESKKFSLVADVKIIWGSSEAVQVISALPQKEHCEIIAMGPKYSFGVFDKSFIESDFFDKALKDTTVDISLFNQMACSSPHVIFFEKSKFSLKEIAEKIKTNFELIPEKLINQYVPDAMASRIINERGKYLLDLEKDIIKSDDISWTILINNEINLEDPVQGRTIFIKEIENINEVIPLITRKIQAINASILDNQKKKDFAKEATYRGVDRITTPGKIHNFGLPWDGILILNRLVRWVIIKN